MWHRHSTRSSKRHHSRSASARRQFVETLESRELLAILTDTPGATPPAQPSTVGPVVAGTQTSGSHFISMAEAQQRELEAAFRQASNLQQYTDAELNRVNSWVVQLRAGANSTAVAQRVNAASFLPTNVIRDTYVYTPSAMTTQSIISTLRSDVDVRYFYPLVELEKDTRLIPNDPLFPDQWHLQNTGQTGGTVGADANLVPAWDMATGNGSVIAVVDDGFQHTHPDLAPNYDATLSIDIVDNDADPAPLLNPCFLVALADCHGTSVGGVAAAAGNNMLGVTGAGFDATLAGIRLLGANQTDMTEATALSHMNQAIDIYNNSWGPPDDGDVYPLGPLPLAAMQNGVTSGRNGLGNIYTWAGGNGRGSDDYSSVDGYASSRYTLAVGATDHNGRQAMYSESGPALLVSAPSNLGAATNDIGITTTDLLGDDGYNAATPLDPFDEDTLADPDYTSTFGGTSSATPLVSGVIALMLEANPNLSYRDIEHILVQTAADTNPADPDWVTNDAGHTVNHKFGHGVIDAEAAVALASTFQSVGPELALMGGTATVGQTIPDLNVNGLTSTISVTENLNIEWVEVEFDSTHTASQDLQVVLTAPSGTESVLVEQRGLFFRAADYDDYLFTSARHWDEQAQGDWTISVTDLAAQDIGTFESWSISFYGTAAPQLPTNGGEGGNTISGLVWNDTDPDGVYDPTEESGVPGAYIYLDLDNDCRIGVAEPAAISGDRGRYEIPNIPDGTYSLRQVLSPGSILTFPAATGSPCDGHAITLPSTDTYDFGNVLGRDFGDAPEPYVTLLEDNGPSHPILPGFFLGPPVSAGGAGIDSELDGFQTPLDPLVSDDATGVDDEDGVVFLDSIAPGHASRVAVTVTTSTFQGGYLQGFIDFEGDGDFTGPGEQIATDLFVTEGVHEITFNTPATAVPGLTQARFRLSHQRGLGSTGPALDGEVEDHRVGILRDRPQANDDMFTVEQNSTNNQLDVVPNDVPSFRIDPITGFPVPADPLRIFRPFRTVATSQGGTVSIDNQGTASFLDDVISYTPPAGFVGTDTFTYNIVDDAGKTDGATVTVEVEQPGIPIAVDNSFVVNLDSVSNRLDVLVNDIPGDFGPLVVDNFTQPANGIVTPGPGGLNLVYTPATSFEGTDQFFYTIRDANNRTDSATVTVHVRDPLDSLAQLEQNKLVKYRVQVVDLSNNPFPNNKVPIGAEFKVQTYVEDLRDPPVVPNLGVFSGYTDLLYETRHVSVIPDSTNSTGIQLTFGADYPAGRNSISDVESGGGPLGPNEVLLFETHFTADRLGQATFFPDPADLLPVHETSIWPSQIVDDLNDILYLDQTVEIVNVTPLVAIDVQVTDLSGNPLPGGQVAVGSQFKLRMTVDDLRSPATAQDGVFSAYADVTFDALRVTPVVDNTNPTGFDLVFNGSYPSGRNAQFAPGLIDEAGAIQNNNAPPLGSNPVTVFEATFTADSVGTAEFATNRADIQPLHEIVLNTPPTQVPTYQVTFGTTSVTIVPATAPLQNPTNSLDVNDDGFVSPVDALLLINRINTNDKLNGAEGEMFYDTSGDGSINASDVIRIINYLNDHNTGGEADTTGEGEDDNIVIPDERPRGLLADLALFDELGRRKHWQLH